MRQAIRILTTILGLVLGYGVSAHAGYLFVTPFTLARTAAELPYHYGLNAFIYCTVTNYDVKPIVVGVTVYDNFANVLEAFDDECNGAPVPSGHTCRTTVWIALGGEGPQLQIADGGWCRFISSSLKIGAALQVYTDPGFGLPAKLQILLKATRP